MALEKLLLHPEPHFPHGKGGETKVGLSKGPAASEASGKLSGLPSLRLTRRWRREILATEVARSTAKHLREAVICVLSQGAQTFKDDIAPSQKIP